MDRIDPVERPPRASRGPVRAVARAPESAESTRGRRGQSDRERGGSVLEPDGGTERRAALLEDVRTRLHRGALASDLPPPAPSQGETLARRRSLQRDLVSFLALHRPPSEARILAAFTAGALRADRQDQLTASVDHQRMRRSLLEQRTVQAYLETAGLSVDGRLR